MCTYITPKCVHGKPICKNIQRIYTFKLIIIIPKHKSKLCFKTNLFKCNTF